MKWKMPLLPGKMIEYVLRSLLKKPVTVKYPAEKFVMPKNFRGKLNFDPAKCSGCQICVKDCPTNAIQITKIGDKKFRAEIDLGKCIYCAQCVDVCPKKALMITPDYELAEFERGKLKIIFDVKS